MEKDEDGDGDLDDTVTIPYPKTGDYQVTVLPEPDALPTDTFSLICRFGDETIILADNVPVTDVPDEPYILTVEAPLPFFSLSNLTLSSDEVTTGESVTFSIDVSNKGEVEASYIATLKINDATEETREITLHGGASTTVSFTVSKDTPGSYEVKIGAETAEFIVSEPSPAALSWVTILGIIAGAFAFGLFALAIYFFLRPKRPAQAC